MDIVSRLKKFIIHESIAVTQFADNCNIPRPTLSQLLNGRNKKVSDELIGKIHDAYPQLSVLWLMFGEGDMLHNKNIEISEPQKQQKTATNNDEVSKNQGITPSIDFDKNYADTPSENFTVKDSAISFHPAQDIDLPPTTNTPANINENSESKSTITFNPYQKKKIVNIIVYYDDNSFESFVPSVKE